MADEKQTLDGLLNSNFKKEEDKKPEENAQQEQQETTQQTTEQSQQTTEEESKSEITMEQVMEFLNNDENIGLKYLSQKLGRDIDSFDNLVTEKVVEKEVTPDMPDVVKKFWDYTNDTGRKDIKDFMSANKDWESESEESVVKEYLRQQKGFEGEDLQMYFDLQYKPNEDEVTEKEMKLAKLEFKSDYKKAINFLNEQKEKYRLPSDDIAKQREALEQEAEVNRSFSENMLKAVRNTNDIKIGDVELKFDKYSGIEDDFQSLNSITNTYKSDKGFSHDKLFKDLYLGRNFEKLAKAYHELMHNQYIEAERAKLENKTPTGQTKVGDSDTNIGKANAKKILFGT